MTITVEQLQDSVGDVYSSTSDKIVSIGQVYLADTTGTPSWVTVKTGLFGTSETFVPLEGGRVDGHDIYVDAAEDRLEDAPRTKADGSLSPQKEDELYRPPAPGDGTSSVMCAAAATHPTMTTQRPVVTATR